MAQITIQSAELSKTGKSHVIKSTQGTTYFAKPDQGLINHVGKTIECEITTSEYQGKSMLWINKFKLLGEAAAPMIPAQQATPPAKPMKIAEYWQPMASNVVAQAIQAGFIKEPNQIRPWVVAVKDALDNVNDDVAF